jgi:hypothetical protein
MKDPEKDFDECRFPGAVRTEESKDFTLADLKRNFLKCWMNPGEEKSLPVSFREILYVDCKWRCQWGPHESMDGQGGVPRETRPRAKRH